MRNAITISHNWLQGELALRGRPAVACYNVLSLNVENNIWGDPLKQAGPETDWESPIEEVIFCPCCFLASAALSILVLKCSRMAAPAFDTSQEDKRKAAFPCLGWVCSVRNTLQGGLGGFCSVVQIRPGKARYANASVSVILYYTHALKQSGSCHLSQIS